MFSARQSGVLVMLNRNLASGTSSNSQSVAVEFLVEFFLGVTTHPCPFVPFPRLLLPTGSGVPWAAQDRGGGGGQGATPWSAGEGGGRLQFVSVAD